MEMPCLMARSLRVWRRLSIKASLPILVHPFRAKYSKGPLNARRRRNRSTTTFTVAELIHHHTPATYNPPIILVCCLSRFSSRLYSYSRPLASPMYCSYSTILSAGSSAIYIHDTTTGSCFRPSHRNAVRACGRFPHHPENTGTRSGVHIKTLRYTGLGWVGLGSRLCGDGLVHGLRGASMVPSCRAARDACEMSWGWAWGAR